MFKPLPPVLDLDYTKTIVIQRHMKHIPFLGSWTIMLYNHTSIEKYKFYYLTFIQMVHINNLRIILPYLNATKIN